MLTIGKLAQLSGTTARTVRHYHAVGLLPEPARRGNGYREYGVQDLVRLVRVRRLVGLGLSLAEVRDAVRSEGSDGGELRGILTGLEADLFQQELVIRHRRERLRELLGRDGDLVASDVLVDLLREVAVRFPGCPARQVAQERELLEVLEATCDGQRWGQLADAYRAALRDPDRAARLPALVARFDALSHVAADDPEVERLATDIADAGAGLFPRDTEDTEDAEGTDGGGGQDSSGREARRQPLREAFLATLTPAQRRCLELVPAGWS